MIWCETLWLKWALWVHFRTWTHCLIPFLWENRFQGTSSPETMKTLVLPHFLPAPSFYHRLPRPQPRGNSIPAAPWMPCGTSVPTQSPGSHDLLTFDPSHFTKTFIKMLFTLTRTWETSPCSRYSHHPFPPFSVSPGSVLYCSLQPSLKGKRASQTHPRCFSSSFAQAAVPFSPISLPLPLPLSNPSFQGFYPSQILPH